MSQCVVRISNLAYYYSSDTSFYNTDDVWTDNDAEVRVWRVACGVWCAVCSVWCVVYGVSYVVRGVPPLLCV